MHFSMILNFYEKYFIFHYQYFAYFGYFVTKVPSSQFLLNFTYFSTYFEHFHANFVIFSKILRKLLIFRDVRFLRPKIIFRKIAFILKTINMHENCLKISIKCIFFIKDDSGHILSNFGVCFESISRYL